MGLFSRKNSRVMTEAEYISGLCEVAADPTVIGNMLDNSINPDHPPDSKKLRNHAAAVQWYAVNMYNLAHHHNDNLAMAALHAQQLGSLGMKILYDKYMGAFEPLLSVPGRTAISDDFVEDIANTFKDVCGKEVSATDEQLVGFARGVYKNTFSRCEDKFDDRVVRRR